MLAVLMAVLSGKDPGEEGDDVRLLEELHRRYAGVVYDKCVNMLRDRQEAEDAVQETFLTAYRVLDRVRERPAAARLPWLYCIATHVCLHVLRTRRRKGFDPVGDAPEVESNQDQERTTSMRQQLELLLTELDDRGMEIVVAHFIDGLEQGQIAQSLGISRRAVVKRLAALRLRVGRIFDSAGEGTHG